MSCSSLLQRVLCIGLLAPGALYAQQALHLTGEILTPDSRPVPGAMISAGSITSQADASGHFDLALPAGIAHIVARAAQYAEFRTDLELEADSTLDIQLRPNESITVHADANVLEPDPSSAAYTRDDLLPANPGRPGIPFSVPGFPTETASGGIKAPQYFAPGVAGDHGEPIAQFFQIGQYLFPNNLTANAHGNGYSDPNIIIPGIIGGVQVDNAAFNARYGDHSINLAVNYTVRSLVERSITLASDGHDGDIFGIWASRRHPTWLAAEMSFGNGFLARDEQREQYKLDGLRALNFGNHELTLFCAAYYGFSRIPGLIPLDTPVEGDTIDRNQKDLTHTTLAIVTDTWKPSDTRQLTLSAFQRTYSLALDSDFGLGLLEQSEFRTVQGANATYTRKLGTRWTALGGVDYRRDAPRHLDLAHAPMALGSTGTLNESSGPLALVTSNDLTITDAAPFAALEGSLGRGFRLYAGLRRDQLDFENTDHLLPTNSFNHWPGTTSPKATLTWGREEGSLFPQLSLSFGKAFHANDPRIGATTGSGVAGAAHGQLIIQSREYQLLVGKVLAGTEFRLTLAHQTNSEELAKIDPDTGLQQDVGPSVNRYFTVMARRRYGRGFLQASYSQANATDRQLHQPIPEAPRLIIDAISTVERLPMGLSAKAEYEYVGEKPLGDGFRGVPVEETRLSLQKSLADGRWILAGNLELASGASGQTLETFALPVEAAAGVAPLERRVGVPLRSYGSISLEYRFPH